jgi:hypothetical protein
MGAVTWAQAAKESVRKVTRAHGTGESREEVVSAQCKEPGWLAKGKTGERAAVMGEAERAEGRAGCRGRRRRVKGGGGKGH